MTGRRDVSDEQQLLARVPTHFAQRRTIAVRPRSSEPSSSEEENRCRIGYLTDCDNADVSTTVPPPAADTPRKGNSAHCTVERFNNASTADITPWFFRMENNFKVSGVQEEEWVNNIIANINKIHFPECHSLKNESYPPFPMKVINIVEKPNMS